MASPNKAAATETELGGLHKLVFRVFKYKLDSWIKMMETGADPDLVVDNKQLAVIMKFLENNNITALAEEDEEASQLGVRLKQIKAQQQLRVVGDGLQGQVSFRDEE